MRLRLVDALRKTDALKLREEFLRSQWFSREDIEALQWGRLQALLRHSYNQVPYYRSLMERAGLTPDRIRSWEDFQRLPTLTKQDIKRVPDAFMARNANQFQPRLKTTGGSTGEPLRYWVDRRTHSAAWAFLYRAWEQGGWTPGDRVVVLGGSSLVPSFSAFKKWAYVKLNNWLLLSAFQMGEGDMLRWVERVRRFRGKILYCYASSGYEFARFLEARAIRDIRFQAVFTTAEVLQPAFRETIERVFSCPVFDTYGGVDGAGYAFECERHEGLHIVSENGLVEILGDDGKPAHGEELGEVVTTDLFNYAMPFIRYRVGDIASRTEAPCACGRGLPRLKSIQGRVEAFLINRRGEKVHGQFLDYVFRGIEGVRRFYAEQDSADRIRVFVVPESERFGDRHFQPARDLIGAKFEGMDVEFRLVDDIPPLANGKFRYVVNTMSVPAAGAPS